MKESNVKFDIKESNRLLDDLLSGIDECSDMASLKSTAKEFIRRMTATAALLLIERDVVLPFLGALSYVFQRVEDGEITNLEELWDALLPVRRAMAAFPPELRARMKAEHD